MPASTGLPRADAADDFMRARRRHALARLGRRLGGTTDVQAILPFEEVVAALGRTGERSLGLQVIELDTIVGTVDRGSGGFDRKFRPTTPAVRTRWERIATMMRKGEALPPIDVYRIGEVHFVKDGHHRVSVARTLGHTTISAMVTEVRTRVGASKTLRVSDLPHKSHERLFRERVPVSADVAERLAVADPDRYSVLAETIEAWGFRTMQERGAFLDREDVAALWFNDEFLPVVEMIRSAHLVPTETTDADAYMDVACERWNIAFTHEWSPELLQRVRDAR